MDNSPVAGNSSKNAGDIHREQQLSATKKPDAVTASNNLGGQINSCAADTAAMSLCEIKTGDENMKRNDRVTF